MFRVDIFYAIYDTVDEIRIHEYITSIEETCRPFFARSID